MTPITLNTLKALKAKGEKFSVLTCYDATFSTRISQAGIEAMLIGDSLGMVLQGHDSTLPVTMDDMVYHTQCVSRGNQGSLIMADLPFLSDADIATLLNNAARLMRAGAHMVKIEGDHWLAEGIQALSQRGVPVCAHLGLTPQMVNQLGGYRVQGRGEAGQLLIETAKKLEAAGASAFVLECVPSEIGQAVTQAVSAPVIGIGAGPDTDGQVLVMHDMLGATVGHTAKFVKNFMTEAGDIQAAFEAFHQAVKQGQFPAPEHCFK
ncbi:3-methyl-2-oxobutanoate hydroxymethyltransferase [Terasakiispira papahanaumokuakeensis]|uniref:3-methyl-2-oxobutanoate hydroxymethyltransferase n=1 Tax=Terasakiispira papahanaumokuakeensis TaxID=197479 RepID=A0A1E2VCG3_9GAMM|nr:3-methyl-2-oxobutanoate hydroxymethyltransferase [Terasakiispira papahanaumokuakeensis]ODC04689.1 3-methyl-2-oxobutanoate hydroxymethyltransferase [Terasakiispira papahanaumokuakeensis]